MFYCTDQINAVLVKTQESSFKNINKKKHSPNLNFWTVYFSYVNTSNLGFVDFSFGLSRKTAGHAVDLALAAWHTVEDVDVQVLLNDVPYLVIMPFLQVSLEQLVRVSGDAQHKTAGAEVQQRLVPLQVLFLSEAAENLQVIVIVTLLIAAEPISTQENNWLSHYQRVQSLELQNKNDYYYQTTLIKGIVHPKMKMWCLSAYSPKASKM